MLFHVYLFVWLLEILLNLKKLRRNITILNELCEGKKNDFYFVSFYTKRIQN